MKKKMANCFKSTIIIRCSFRHLNTSRITDVQIYYYVQRKLQEEEVPAS